MILLTGGAGYIGSHMYLALSQAGQASVLLDNFSNSHPQVLERLASITGKAPLCIRGDVRDSALLKEIFARHRISAVVHFAALKAVAQSVEKPLDYYDNNVGGTMSLMRAMAAADVRTLVFSSSATVYGDPDSVPVREDAPLRATNPYGWTKLMMEQILADVDRAEPGRWRIARLRYFNPVGAHESGLIGEDPRGIPNNLMPYVAQVAAGQRERLNVYGNDYPTPDGTGVRDYIHVCDLAEGHIAALDYLRSHPGMLTVNLGTGKPASVLDMVASFERASGRPVPYTVAARRPGDVAQCWADASLAQTLLGWRARRDTDAMCRDTWRWQNHANPSNPGRTSDTDDASANA
ncbi:UDP-glucose 4-epimerase GalE [Comamonas sp. NLF-1-9]|uniref:UDP-glucose 4-epimerase GalE n=1 Tax=Comamonas sp. NLF-1-9 TaxID=2853163 RepID=UPI001C481590|nr:UDP-glucose 4-epimerase GalE [Comamonas sp. NLF-1-9]QXL83256.1 UDP-glucose 4-epimerase GalE [Comamonas sp. NLF-1-9]